MSSHEGTIHCPKCGLELTRNDRIANKPLVRLLLSQARRYHCYICDYSFTVFPWAMEKFSHQSEEAPHAVCQLPVKEYEAPAADHDSSTGIVDVLSEWGVLEKGSAKAKRETEPCEGQQASNEDPDTEEIDYRALIENSRERHI